MLCPIVYQVGRFAKGKLIMSKSQDNKKQDKKKPAKTMKEKKQAKKEKKDQKGNSGIISTSRTVIEVMRN